MVEKVWLALRATAFPCACTAAGAASVFVVGSGKQRGGEQVMNGFAAGVMLAASLFSLLLPAVQSAAGWAAPTLGFALGVLGLAAAQHLAGRFWQPGAVPGRSSRAALGIALHNLPEGMVVGLAAVLAVSGSAEMRAGAAALSLGIGVQNLPEGAAVSLTLHRAGQSRNRAFAAGVASGLVEPLGGMLAALLAVWVRSLLPWLLAGAAGVMVGITLQDLVPEAVQSRRGTAALWLGFVVMMALDLAL